MKWTLIGVDFHSCWRNGGTWCDCHGGNNFIGHHGLYSLEWARGRDVEWFRSLRHSFWRRTLRARSQSPTDRGAG